MGNFKVKFNTPDESKEAQELIFKLGATLGNGDHHAVMAPGAIGLAVIDGLINFVFSEVVPSGIAQAREITLQELRAMVNDQYAEIEQVRQHQHYFIDVSDVGEIDFYEIALRYNVTDPCIQHILKKCLAVGQRGQKDFHHDLKDIYDTAKRMLAVHGLDS